MILEATTRDRLNALRVHRDYLKALMPTVEDEDVPVYTKQLGYTEQLLGEMEGAIDDPKGHWVVVTSSRKVESGSVGTVVYASKERNHCRVEFGNGERVSCGLRNVDIIDWTPLPAFIPLSGARVRIFVYEGDFIATEWDSDRVKLVSVDNPLPENAFWYARNQIKEFAHMID